MLAVLFLFEYVQLQLTVLWVMLQLMPLAIPPAIPLALPQVVPLTLGRHSSCRMYCRLHCVTACVAARVVSYGNIDVTKSARIVASVWCRQGASKVDVNDDGNLDLV